jgi:superfamily II DNA or RNA helicase
MHGESIKRDKKLNEYLKFLETKIVRFEDSGFRVSSDKLNDNLFDFQKHCVSLALRKGRFGLFEECGLGKTIQQLEWAHQVVRHTNKPVLVLTPLAVSAQTIAQGEKFGIEVRRYDSNTKAEIYIINYEQLENVDCSVFAGVVPDESGIMKNFEGRTKQRIVEAFARTPYKLPCSATPSPNDVMELGNHSEFLNALSRNEMLSMYFVHDGGDTASWRLKGHAENDFWAFVASWSLMISRPSDLGFSDEGFVLPELKFHDHKIITDKRDNGFLFNDIAVSATGFNQELRITKEKRLNKAVELAQGRESCIIWIKQNEEADYIKSLMPDAVEVRGNERTEVKEAKLLAFANGEFRVLVTKTKIAAWGMNYQNCHKQIFASLDFSFESLYQAVRRSYRFGQTQPVDIHLITTDTMQNVVDAIERKEKQFNDMREKMITASQAVRIEPVSYKAKHSEYKNEHAFLKRGDCVQLVHELPDESVGFSIFSPPFASLYTYSDKLEDMGNCSDYDAFVYSFSQLVYQLHRVVQSGRNVAVHCMDLPIQKGKEGFIGLRDFSGMIRECFENAGFIYHSRVTIWKDPVTEMQRTKALGLLHKQVKKDAAMSRVGIPDYLLVFRKPGEHLHPVKCDIPVDTWQQYASPVWMDIDYGKTLNGREARHENDERHICPLQLETIERAIHLWTNEGDTVFTPFMGIGSEVYQAVKMRRKGIGFELKDSYFDIAVKNVQAAIDGKKQVFLFR